MSNLFKVKRIKHDGEYGHALVNPNHIVNVVPHKAIEDASVVRFSNGALLVIDGSLDALLDVFDPACEEVGEDEDGQS